MSLNGHLSHLQLQPDARQHRSAARGAGPRSAPRDHQTVRGTCARAGFRLGPAAIFEGRCSVQQTGKRAFLQAVCARCCPESWSARSTRRGPGRSAAARVRRQGLARAASLPRDGSRAESKRSAGTIGSRSQCWRWLSPSRCSRVSWRAGSGPASRAEGSGGPRSPAAQAARLQLCYIPDGAGCAPDRFGLFPASTASAVASPTDGAAAVLAWARRGRRTMAYLLNFGICAQPAAPRVRRPPFLRNGRRTAGVAR